MKFAFAVMSANAAMNEYNRHEAPGLVVEVVAPGRRLAKKQARHVARMQGIVKPRVAGVRLISRLPQA